MDFQTYENILRYHIYFIITLTIIYCISELLYWSYHFITDKKYNNCLIKKTKLGGCCEWYDSVFLAVLLGVLNCLLFALMWPIVYLVIIFSAILFTFRYLIRLKPKTKENNKMKKSNVESSLYLKERYEELKAKLEEIKKEMLEIKAKAKKELEWIMTDEAE